MGSEVADSLRAEQRAIVDYWAATAQAGELPTRNMLNPGQMHRWLARMSILELMPQGQLAFRLSGSQLRETLGVSPRGRTVSDFSSLCKRAWGEGVFAAVERRRPITGITTDKGRIAHAWLRLPLLCDVTGACLVLCHDRYPTERHDAGETDHAAGVSGVHEKDSGNNDVRATARFAA